jgi:MFS transporter, DHA1 family, multidrug resistance protein
VTGSAESAGWRRNVWALALVVFVAFVGFQSFEPFLPLYVRELGVADPGRVALWSGLIAAVTPAVSGLLGPFFGRLADRFGRKAMLIRSLVAFVIIMSAMGLVTSVEQLFVARLLMGFFAGFTPLAMALASVSAPREKVPEAIGLVQSAQLLSVAIGPAAGGYLATRFGIRSALFATAGLCALALIGLIVLFKELAPLASRHATVRLPLRQVFGYPHFMFVLILLVIAQYVDRSLALLVPLRVAHLPSVEAVAATSGFIISIAAVAATISANLVARLAQGIPSAHLLMIAFLVGGPLCGAMALAGGWVSLLVLRTLVGLCLGGAITLAYALGGQIVPSENRGAAFGWLAMGVQVGSAVSPLITGALAAASIPVAFLVDAGLVWIGAALLAFGARELRSR